MKNNKTGLKVIFYITCILVPMIVIFVEPIPAIAFVIAGLLLYKNVFKGENYKELLVAGSIVMTGVNLLSVGEGNQSAWIDIAYWVFLGYFSYSEN